MQLTIEIPDSVFEAFTEEAGTADLKTLEAYINRMLVLRTLKRDLKPIQERIKPIFEEMGIHSDEDIFRLIS
jgi:hypothetical protein